MFTTSAFRLTSSTGVIVVMIGWFVSVAMGSVSTVDDSDNVLGCITTQKESLHGAVELRRTTGTKLALRFTAL